MYIRAYARINGGSHHVNVLIQTSLAFFFPFYVFVHEPSKKPNSMGLFAYNVTYAKAFHNAEQDGVSACTRLSVLFLAAASIGHRCFMYHDELKLFRYRPFPLVL